jgi:hypothetical protein
MARALPFHGSPLRTGKKADSSDKQHAIRENANHPAPISPQDVGTIRRSSSV